MGGFLGGLGSLLGGFNTARRIDQEGFDFREQAEQEEWERQRKQELARQADEERNVGIGVDIALGTPEGEDPDFGGLFGQGVDQARTLARVRGRARGTKVGLRGQEAYYDQLLEEQKQAGRIKLQDVRAEDRQEFLELDYKQRAKQPLTAAERRRFEEIRHNTNARVAAMNRRTDVVASRPLGGGRPHLKPTAGGDYVWIYPPDATPGTTPGQPPGPTAAESLVEEPTSDQPPEIPGVVRTGVTAPLPAAMRQVQGMAGALIEDTMKMRDLASQVMAGPGIGHVSQLSQRVAGPHGPEGEFDFLGHTMLDMVYVKSGKQINQQELKKAEQMIPHRSRGYLPTQVQLFEDYLASLLKKYDAYDEEAETAFTTRDDTGTGSLFQLGGSSHGPAVQRRTLPDGRVQLRDAQGSMWFEGEE